MNHKNYRAYAKNKENFNSNSKVLQITLHENASEDIDYEFLLSITDTTGYDKVEFVKKATGEVVKSFDVKKE